MPYYVRRGGLDVQPPPWQCDDIEVTIFLLDASAAALQTLCDRCLNAPGAAKGFRYQPVPNPLTGGHEVALTFQRFNQIFSASADCTQRGFFTYWESAFWVIVRDYSHDRIGPLEILIPYMFVDSWLPMAAGRELYGFPKEGATINAPQTHAAGGQYTVDAPAIAIYGPTAPVVPTRVIECRSLPRATEITFAQKPLLGELLNLGQLNFVFLREFRATGGGADADLQQVVRATAKPFAVGLPQSLSIMNQITLAFVQSHPIAHDLGIHVNAQGQVFSPLMVECRAQFTMNGAVVIAP